MVAESPRNGLPRFICTEIDGSARLGNIPSLVFFVTMNPSSPWDQRYLRVAHQVALWSKDPSTQCGAVLVRPNRTLASVGFNGFPRGMNDHPDLYAHRPTKYGRVIHSEWNAIQSSHDPSLEGYTVYAWPMPPCDLCTAALAQKGISRVVCPIPAAEKLERWKDQFVHAHGTWEQKGAAVNPLELEFMSPLFAFAEGTEKWDGRFLNLAAEAASWSKDPISPRGAVIVRPDKTIASMGFNGFPQGVDDRPLVDGDAAIRSSRLIQAELNAILFSQDPTLQGSTAYVWSTPSDMRASVHLIHEGVRRLVVPVREGEEGVSPEVLAAWIEVGGCVEQIQVTNGSA